MPQALCGAETGIHETANFLMNNYAPPTATAGAQPPMPAGYNIIHPVPAACGDSPCVTDPAGNPIVLSSLSGVAANYPDAAPKTAFNAATKSARQAGNTPGN